LLTSWNVWTKQGSGPNRFLSALAHQTQVAEEIEAAEDKVKLQADAQVQNAGEAKAEKAKVELPPYARKFFCHKIVVMHPYTDESLLGDMLRRLAFWGERSVGDVQAADQAAEFLFPDERSQEVEAEAAGSCPPQRPEAEEPEPGA
jgi:hypothetical protein